MCKGLFVIMQNGAAPWKQLVVAMSNPDYMVPEVEVAKRTAALFYIT